MLVGIYTHNKAIENFYAFKCNQVHIRVRTEHHMNGIMF